MSKHTPGPWNAWPAAGSDEWIVSSDGGVNDGSHICRIVEDDWNPHALHQPNGAANAALIAAAPDLLAAAEAALKWLTLLADPNAPDRLCRVEHYSEYHRDALCAAITKARGEE